MVCGLSRICHFKSRLTFSISLYLSFTITMSNTQEPQAQITNTLFPPPPEFYKQFTHERVARYAELTNSEAGPSRSPRGIPVSAEREELSTEERQEMEGLRVALQPPRSDWVEEEGRWVTFGELSTVSWLFMLVTFDYMPRLRDHLGLWIQRYGVITIRA